jgi:hypothetical protein
MTFSEKVVRAVGPLIETATLRPLTVEEASKLARVTQLLIDLADKDADENIRWPVVTAPVGFKVEGGNDKPGHRFGG